MITTRCARFAWVAVPLAVLALVTPTAQDAPRPSPIAASAESTLAIPFVENQDTLDDARFTARTFAGAVHVTRDGELVYVLPHTSDGAPHERVVLRERLEGDQPLRVAAGPPSPTRVSVFRGSDPTQWRSGLPTCRSVSISGADAGVELEVQARAQNVEKVFRLAPGVDPDTLRVRVDGAEALHVSDSGELVVDTSLGAVSFTRPVAYQECAEGRTPVEVAYVTDGERYGFAVESHDARLPLVIDPLIAATYLGSGGNDWAYDVEAHYSGGVYVAGYTDSGAFPTASSGYDSSFNGGQDAFVALFSDDLETLVACTFLGGAGAEKAAAVSVGTRGVWAGGRTNSTDFPTTAGVVFPTSPGGTSDGWVAKLSFDLTSLDASSYYGGSGSDELKDVVAAGGQLYLAGETRSDDLWFPPRAMQKVRAGSIDCFFTTMHENLDAVSFQTLLGGSSSDSVARIAPGEGRVLACGDTYSSDFPVTPGAYSTSVTGEGDAWVAHLYEDGSALQGCTYLGGAAMSSEIESATGVAWGPDGVYVAGYTNASTFPTTPGAFQTTFSGAYDTEGFVTFLDTNLSSVVSSTLLGGSGVDEIRGLHATWQRVSVTGYTDSPDFPAISSGNDTTYNGSRDAFVAAFPPDLGTLVGSTYLGGPSNEGAEAIWVRDDTYFVAGYCRGPDFPATPDAFDENYNATGLRPDAFVAALTLEKGAPPVPDVDAYILPKKLNVKHKAPAERSKLFSLGVFDTGSAPVTFGDPATLTVGDANFEFVDLPLNRRGVYTYVAKGVRMKIKPAKSGSSKAKFNLKIKDAKVAGIGTDEPVTIRFQMGELDGGGRVQLTKGRYRIGRQRGALIGPHVCLFNCRAVIRGKSKDSISVKLGLPSGEGTPKEPSDVKVQIGEKFSFSIPAAEFERKKEAYVFRGEKSGVTKLILDYGKEKVTIKGKALDLGDVPDGPQAVPVSVQVGDDPPYVVRVRMVRTKRKLKY